VTGPFALELDVDLHGYRILEVDTKRFPAEGGLQAVLSLFDEMIADIATEAIAEIRVRTYWGLWFEAGSEPEKWDPRTRETADHSLPYILAVVLRDRRLTLAAFEDASIHDPDLRPLMAMISVVEDPELTGDHPTIVGPTEITIRQRDGTTTAAMTGIARGNHRNPMSDGELVDKVRNLAEGIVPPASLDAVIEGLWAIDQAPDVGETVRAWATLVDRPSV
jgi:2-methylcitrate dehydratase